MQYSQQKAQLKSLLLQQLQQKKLRLKQMQQKCALQNKKIKLYRKENEQLQGAIAQINQSDTNLLLGSKELLAVNAKMERTIEQLKAELERAKRVEEKSGNSNNVGEKKYIQGKSQTGKQEESTSQPATTQSKDYTNIPSLSILTIRQSTLTQSTVQIDLPNCQLTDQQFTQLQSFPQLKSIIVNDNLLTNYSISIICNRFPLLQKLNLANNKFDSQGIEEIGNLSNLITLDVRNNALGDQGVGYIAKLGKLTELSCSKNNITDKALPNLCSLKQLSYLDITNNFLTCQSLDPLMKMQKLTHLYLMSNKLNKSSIISLLRSLKSLRFLDVRFNVCSNQQKIEIRANKPQNIQVFC